MGGGGVNSADRHALLEQHKGWIKFFRMPTDYAEHLEREIKYVAGESLSSIIYGEGSLSRIIDELCMSLGVGQLTGKIEHKFAQFADELANTLFSSLGKEGQIALLKSFGLDAAASTEISEKFHSHTKSLFCLFHDILGIAEAGRLAVLLFRRIVIAADTSIRHSRRLRNPNGLIKAMDDLLKRLPPVLLPTHERLIPIFLLIGVGCCRKYSRKEFAGLRRKRIWRALEPLGSQPGGDSFVLDGK